MRRALALGSILLLAACSARAPSQDAAPAQLQGSAPSGSVTLAKGPPPEPEQVALPSGPVGTAHLFTMLGADPEARWVVACQARTDTDGDGKIQVQVGHHGDMFGDAMLPYLVLGAGPGEPIDAFVTSDRRGNHVAYLRDHKLLVHDVRRGTTLDLSAFGADGSDDPSPFGAHRALSFDAAGKRMLYLRGTGDKTVAVVRDVATGAETVLSPGGGILWRAAFSADDRNVVAQVITSDTDGDGKVSPPEVKTSLSKRGCRGPIMSFSTGGSRGDTPEPRIASASGGAFRAVPGLVGTLGEMLVVNEPTGLSLLEGTKKTTLGTGTCELLRADHARTRVVYRCDDELFWWSPAGARSLGFKGQKTSLTHARLVDEQPRWVALDAGPLSLLDLETGVLVPLGKGEVAEVLAGDTALLMRRDKDNKVTHTLFDIEKGTRKVVLTRSTDVAPERVAGHVGALDGKLIDVTTGAITGTYDVQPLALAVDGRILHAPASPKRNVPARFDLPTGPLEWKAPK